MKNLVQGTLYSEVFMEMIHVVLVWVLTPCSDVRWWVRIWKMSVVAPFQDIFQVFFWTNLGISQDNRIEAWKLKQRYRSF